MSEIQAITSISSKSTSLVVQSLLNEFNVSAVDLDNAQALMSNFQQSEHQSLCFVSLEILKDIHSEPAEALKMVRSVYYGSLFVLSSNSSQEEFRNLIEQGATDIIDVGDIESLRGILNTFSIFKELNNIQRELVALVVEDSPSQRKLIETILEKKGVRSLVIPTVREALMVLKFEPVDFVITDIHLSGDLTGMHLLREICQSTQWQGIPVFVVSGVVPDSQVKEYYKLGVRDFMLKPLDIELFTLRIANLILERQTFIKLREETYKLNQIAFTDTLTGIGNRAFLKKHYGHWASEHANDFYAFMLDLDNLKVINDDMGHDAGDEAIKTVTGIVNDHMTDNDLLIRLGGDEFIGLVKDDNPTRFKERLTNILNDISAIKKFPGVSFSASIGVIKVDQFIELRELLKRCDVMMYSAKISGKNQIEYEAE